MSFGCLDELNENDNFRRGNKNNNSSSKSIVLSLLHQNKNCIGSSNREKTLIILKDIRLEHST